MLLQNYTDLDITAKHSVECVLISASGKKERVIVSPREVETASFESENQKYVLPANTEVEVVLGKKTEKKQLKELDINKKNWYIINNIGEKIKVSNLKIENRVLSLPDRSVSFIEKDFIVNYAC